MADSGSGSGGEEVNDKKRKSGWKGGILREKVDNHGILQECARELLRS